MDEQLLIDGYYQQEQARIGMNSIALYEIIAPKKTMFQRHNFIYLQ